MLEGWEELKLKEYLKNKEIKANNIEIVNDYIKKASKFIEKRTNEMVNKLLIIYDDFKKKRELQNA